MYHAGGQCAGGVVDGITKFEKSKIEQSINSLKLERKFCLDFGCGGGTWTVLLRQAGAQVIGVDSSLQVEQEFRQRNPGSAFMHYGFERQPFADKSMDLVCSLWFLETISRDTDFEIAIKEMNRLVKWGGYLLVAQKLYPENRLNFVRNAGLTEIFFDNREQRELRYFPKNSLKKFFPDLEIMSCSMVDNSFVEMFVK